MAVPILTILAVAERLIALAKNVRLAAPNADSIALDMAKDGLQAYAALRNLFAKQPEEISYEELEAADALVEALEARALQRKLEPPQD